MDRYRESRHIELNIPQSMYQAVLPPKLRGGGGGGGGTLVHPPFIFGEKKGYQAPKIYDNCSIISREHLYYG